MRARSTTALCLVLALAVFGLTGCNADGTLHLPTGVVYPSIKPAETPAAAVAVEHTFTFEGKTRTVSVTVDGPILAGARAAEKSVIRLGNARENDWIKDYYPAFAFEPHQDAFFSALLGQLHTIRDAEGLDASRYAELMTAFVQSLEYRTDPVNLSPKFPVETFADQSGDCDDKAILLGSLLSREGYGVAIMLFGAEQHVALGIKASALDYRDSGYAYIETTTQGFVGMPPDTIGSGTVLKSEPQILPLKGGDTVYDAADQVAVILDTHEAAQKLLAALSDELDAVDANLKRMGLQPKEIKARMDAAQASGDTATYNALVPDYNHAADAYNAALQRRNELVVRHNRAIETVNYIGKHLDDRRGTYAYIRFPSD